MDNLSKDIIPENEDGIETNTSHAIKASSKSEAIKLFETAKERLQDLNNWDKFCGTGSAIFRLTDAQGKDVSRKPEIGDHFKIDLPAPGTKSGDGYDWVRIEAIEDKSDSSAIEESFAIRVRPCENPENNQQDTAHFLKEDATSSFIVERENKKVTASVHGRNEKPNTDSHSIVDRIRNTLVGLGAVAGISKLQWKKLVKGLLE
jgi:hypothetical protein